MAGYGYGYGSYNAGIDYGLYSSAADYNDAHAGANITDQQLQEAQLRQSMEQQGKGSEYAADLQTRNDAQRAEYAEWARTHPMDSGWGVFGFVAAIAAVAVIVASAGAAAPALAAAEAGGASVAAGVSTIEAATAAATTAVAGGEAAAASYVAGAASAIGDAIGAAAGVGAMPVVNVVAPSIAAGAGLTGVGAAGAAAAAGAIGAGLTGLSSESAGAPVDATPVDATPVDTTPAEFSDEAITQQAGHTADGIVDGALANPTITTPPPVGFDPVEWAKQQAINAGKGAAIGAVKDALTGGSKDGTNGGTNGSTNGGTDGGGNGLLTLAGLTAALAAFNGGNKDVAVDPAVQSSISSLTKNGNDQMAEWNNFMFPKLNGALSDQKAQTDLLVSGANTSASKLDSMGDTQRADADAYNARNKSVYIPLADKIIADANKFSKDDYAAQQQGLSMGDIEASYAAQRLAQQQEYQKYGIDPTSGRAIAARSAAGITNAANEASAATRARIEAEKLWGQKQMDALGTSTVLNANAKQFSDMQAAAAGMYKDATGLRNTAATATSNYFTNVNSLAASSNSAYTTANNAYKGAGQLGLDASKLNNDRYIAETTGRGTVIGAGLSALNNSGSANSAMKYVKDAAGNITGFIANGVKTMFDGTSSSVRDTETGSSTLSPGGSGIGTSPIKDETTDKPPVNTDLEDYP